MKPILFIFGIIVPFFICGVAADENHYTDSSPENNGSTEGVATITSTTFPPGPFRSRRNFGETCNKALRCDKKAWLNCIDGSCDCMRPDEMMYVANKSKCVSKSGERCKFQVLTPEPDNTALVEKTECVDNAECGSSGTCVCLKNFFENYNGTCSPKRGFNETCVMDVECKDETYMSCINGTCICGTNQILGRSRDICYGMAGKVLTKSKNCGDGSTLNSSGICSCDNPKFYYAGIDGRCHLRKSHNEVCSEDVECVHDKTYLTCVNGTCGCDPENAQYREFVESVRVEKERQEYNSERYHHSQPYYNTVKYTEVESKNFNQCVGLAGKKCSVNSKCVVNAACITVLSTPICRCDIESGYSQTSTGICGIGYNRACSANILCSDSFTCTEGKCECPQPNHQIYNSTTDTCVGIVHGTCSTDSNCIANTKCIINPVTNVKQCECPSEFVENTEGSCDVAFGSPCNYGSKPPCDKLAALKCRNGICACPDPTTKFNKDTRQCLGLVGSRCGGPGIDCVTNAECFKEAPKLPGVCRCHSEYKVNDDRFCTTVRTTRDTSSADLV